MIINWKQNILFIWNRPLLIKLYYKTIRNLASTAMQTMIKLENVKKKLWNVDGP